MSEEEQIQLALALSTQDQDTPKSTSRSNASSSNNSNNSTSSSKIRRVEVDDNYFIREIKKGFSALYKDRVGADTLLVLKPSDIKINCHSLVLSVWSETFRALLKGNSINERL